VESQPSKRRILEKKERGEHVLKSKSETSFEEFQVSKKEREDEIYKMLGEILLK
jgi:hypothetical protein